MSISLYNIEDALQQLVELREQAEIEGDSEALKVIDDQLQQYLKNEAAKIDSYAGIIRQLGADAAVVKAEADRLYDRAKAMEARRDAIKAAALAAMQAHDIKMLKTATNTLRRQGNGGKEPLEITSSSGIPEGLKNYMVTMRGDLYHWLFCVITEWEKDHAVHPLAYAVLGCADTAPNTGAIREALKQVIVCPECKGDTFKYKETAKDEARAELCPRCKGEGTIPNSIPGVKLLPKGEHLRVE